jgi:SAM-dependent methyltransferase
VIERGASDAAVLAWLRAEHDRPFTGWDFSPIHGRRSNSDTKSWDLAMILLDEAARASAVLDVDTGEGKVLLDLHAARVLPRRATATEAWPPNVPLAAARLEPLGVNVVHADPSHMPFRDAAFDLVTNRHGGLTAPELARVLRPGGRFVTQQVGSLANRAIHEMLGTDQRGEGPSPTEHWDLATARAGLQAAGLRVERAEEAFPLTTFADVGALAWYLKAVPWEVPNFDVDRHATPLLALHRRVERGERIEVGFHLFLLLAERPG